jgi:hypothetical protein
MSFLILAVKQYGSTLDGKKHKNYGHKDVDNLKQFSESYLLTKGLPPKFFNNAVSIGPKLDKNRSMSDEFIQTWKESIMTCLNILYQHFPGRSKESHKRPKIG